ncbi:LATS, large tumor suppressor [Ceratobasidium sp. AG-Ba]|nr:LATS, large tumor suppressor [Ceratobasidium sp. AG-Ba]QRW11190.1 LATS, large tumor suppressor [Ceratobasidium sp. AG-Ba]
MASPVSVSSQRNSTLVHRGFYDLLSLVPGTPGVGVDNRSGASRFWNDPGGADFVAGMRYEDMPVTPASPTKPPPPPTRSYGLEWAYNYYAGSPASPPKRTEEPQSPKGKRRISKDMVSRPMGFVHLVHASDADQAEAILQRWGPDGLGKLGNPNWAQPIKNHIRARQQERAVAEVMHAMDSTPSTSSAGQPILRVMNGVSTSTLTTTSAHTIPTPGTGTEKSYSRLGLAATPRALATQLEVEEGERAGSTEGRTGHESRDASEVTIKGRSVVPTPAKSAAPAVSTGTGVGYGAGPSRSPTQRSPVQSYSPQNQQGTYVPQQPTAYSPAGTGYPYTPAQPIPYQRQQSGPYPLARSPQQQPLSRSPPTSRSPPKSKSPKSKSPRNQSPVPPKTPPKDRSPARAVPVPVPNRAGPGVGATDDPLAAHAAELMRGVNPGPGHYGSPGAGSPGTIRIHDEGLPMPPGGAWGGGIGEEMDPGGGDVATPTGTGSGGIGMPRGFTNAIIGGRGDKWEADGGVRPPPPKPFRPSLTTLDKAVSAKIYFENVYFPLLRLPPSREQRRAAMEAEMEQLNIPQHMRTQLRAKWRANETAYLRERRRRVDQRAFVKLKTIGHGAFGVVSLVKEKETGELYAMKQMRKVDMLRKGQEGHVRAERDVLKGAALAASPTGADWIVRLFYSFQDQDHLYLVLEFMGGGDLLNLLIERDIFEENFARFYIAEMVLAIEQCHKQGFIHRDIKPDNFLFDPNGHLKLSDFGLATDLHWAHDTSYYEQQRRDLLHKHGIDLDDGESHKARRMDRREAERVMGGGEGIFTWREKNRKKLAYSVCGTNSYMSPEVIRGQGYSFSCDWWSLGVIMFECLYGYPPFVSNSKILNWRTSLRFPPRPKVSREGVDLIERLLCEPEDRIGAQGTLPPGMNRRSGFFGGSVDGAEYIKAHPWFQSIDFTRIHEMEAPFRPELRRPDDTKHFDTDIAPEPLAPANGAPPDATRDPLLRDKVHGPRILESRKALAFAGFTHKSPRKISYGRVDDLLRLSDEDGQQHQLGHGGNDEQRGRTMVKEQGTIGRGRAISM